jgi:hypothetical protein
MCSALRFNWLDQSSQSQILSGSGFQQGLHITVLQGAFQRSRCPRPAPDQLLMNLWGGSQATVFISDHCYLESSDARTTLN